VNRSVPPHPSAPPRPITGDEQAALLRIADALIPARGEDAAPSDIAEYQRHLELALAARDDAFGAVTRLAVVLGALDDGQLDRELRALHARADDGFQALSAIVCGAYLTVPEVRTRIGYPGQENRPPPFDQAAEEIMNGILDPVIARGSRYTPAP
jgi:hypothetical protein